MRVRLAALKGNLQSCRVLMQELAALPGVQRVAANDVTGSIIVHYDPNSLHAARILQIFQERKLLHNVIGFPTSHIHPGQLSRSTMLPAEDWMSETVIYASRIILKTLFEAALQKNRQDSASQNSAMNSFTDSFSQAVTYSKGCRTMLIMGMGGFGVSEGLMQFLKILDESAHEGHNSFGIILYGSFKGLKDIFVNRTRCVNTWSLCFHHWTLGT